MPSKTKMAAKPVTKSNVKTAQKTIAQKPVQKSAAKKPAAPAKKACACKGKK